MMPRPFAHSLSCTLRQILPKIAGCILLVLLLSPVLRAQAGVWLPVQPPYGGSVNSIVMDSSHTLFAATEYQSIVRSTDYGDSWEPTNFSGAEATVLAVGRDSTLFLGTPVGVFSSHDQGASWQGRGLHALPVLSLAIGDSGEIYAGTLYNGVYRSSDDGDSWIPCGLYFKVIQSLAVDSLGYVYAGTSDSAVFRSTDQGRSWTWKAQGFYDFTSVTSFAFDSHHALYAGTASSGLWRSDDHGESWTCLGSVVSNIRSIAFDQNEHCFLASNDGVTMSTDGGITWTVVDSICRSVPVRSLLAVEHAIIAGGRWRGFTRSTDGGKSWMRINNGFDHADICSLAWDKHSTTVYAGVTWDGVYATDDGGQTWRQAWPSRNMVLALAANDSVILAAPTNGQYGIFRSADKGATWEQTELESGVYLALVLAPNGRAYAGRYTVMASADGGRTWSETNLNRQVYCLAVNDSNHIFAGTFTEGLFRSKDDGRTWTSLANFNATIASIAINREGIVFVADASNTLRRSADNGDTWTVAGHGIGTNVVLAKLAIGADNSLLAGTNWGVYRSTDKGESWSNLSDGMRNFQVQALLPGPGGYLYAGMYEGSMYRTHDPLTGVESDEDAVVLPKRTHLLQNYPNPFNPTTKISFTLEARSFVSLKIYDVMGRCVATLVSEEMPPGSYARQWNAADCPSGIYFYRLQSGAYTESRRLVLVK